MRRVRWFLYDPGWPGACSVEQAGLEFAKILPFLPPQCWQRGQSVILWPALTKKKNNKEKKNLTI